MTNPLEKGLQADPKLPALAATLLEKRIKGRLSISMSQRILSITKMSFRRSWPVVRDSASKWIKL